MAKEIDKILKLQVRGGAANPSPPVGPALGAAGARVSSSTWWSTPQSKASTSHGSLRRLPSFWVSHRSASTSHLASLRARCPRRAAACRCATRRARCAPTFLPALLMRSPRPASPSERDHMTACHPLGPKSTRRQRCHSGCLETASPPLPHSRY